MDDDLSVTFQTHRGVAAERCDEWGEDWAIRSAYRKAHIAMDAVAFRYDHLAAKRELHAVRFGDSVRVSWTLILTVAA